MTTEEMSLAFDIAYNNIRSNQAPGIDPYEKSVYLTRAQHDVEEGLYDNIDKNELVRKKLAKLICRKSFKSTEAIVDDTYANVKVFKLTDEDKIRAIIHETLKYDSCDDVCMSNAISQVRPVTYDDLDSVMANPFIFKDWRALRLDGSLDGVKTSKIITTKDLPYTYNVEYVKIASPIFVKGCIDGDVIDGVKYSGELMYECELESTVHQTIVDLAVHIAVENYKS